MAATYAVHGHKLYIACAGQALKGAPTVILEAGINQSGETWRKVMPDIAKLRSRLRGADIPLVAIARGSASFSAEDYPPPLRAFAPEGEKLRIRLQRELAARSRQGTLVFAERSGHFVQNDQPEIVVGAVRAVLAASRHAR